MKKKILSVITAILIMITMLVTAVPVSAWVQYTSPSAIDGSSFTDYPAFAKALNAVFAGDIDLFTEKSLSNEVSLPLGARISMSKQYYIHSSSRNVTTSGWTCYIYGNAAFNKLFGEFVWNAGALKNCYVAVGKGASTMSYSLLKNAGIRPGAYIRTSPKSDGSYYGGDGHSMIILAYDPTYITYLEGNGDGKGLVRVTKRTYSEYNYAQLSGKGRKVSHIVQATEEWFNKLYGESSGPEDNTYSFSYDSNGGTGSENSFTVKYGDEFALSSANFDRDGCVLAGWKLQRDSDEKWHTDTGWRTTGEIDDQKEITTFLNGEVQNFDDSFIKGTSGDTSYTAYAVWENSVYETCQSVTLVSSSAMRDTYPLNSTVSFEGSVIEFNFASGAVFRTTVKANCSSATPQVFKFNGNSYSFYIDSSITKNGDNPCSVHLDSFAGELTTLKAGAAVSSAELISDPTNISGEKASLRINYTDGTNETLTAAGFMPTAENDGTVTGVMWTDGGFTVDWSFKVTATESVITVTYPSEYSKDIIPGDANIDGIINASDLAALKLVLMESSDSFYPLYCIADFNYDGKINATDLSMLKLHLCLD